MTTVDVFQSDIFTISMLNDIITITFTTWGGLTCVKTELRWIGQNGTTCSWKCLMEKISFLKKLCKYTHLHFAFKYITFCV